MSYLTYPVLDEVCGKKIRSQEIELTMDYLLHGEEFQVPRKLMFKLPAEGLNFDLRQRTNSERKALLDFFKDRLGRLKPFWLRVGVTALVLTEETANGGSTVRFRNYNELDAWAGKTLHFYVPLSNQMVKASNVALKSGDATTLEFTISPVASQALPVGTRLERLIFCRFATDNLHFDLEFDARGNREAITTTPLAVVELARETP